MSPLGKALRAADTKRYRVEVCNSVLGSRRTVGQWDTLSEASDYIAVHVARSRSFVTFQVLDGDKPIGPTFQGAS